jgi:two-component system, NtrC family, sensor kinase
MKARMASIAFLLATMATGIAWLSLQPAISALLEAGTRDPASPAPGRALVAHILRLLPLYLAVDLVVIAVAVYAVLYVTVARPLARTATAIDELGRLGLDAELPFRRGGGPLLSRVQSSLGQVVGALRQERELTRRQLQELTHAHERLARAQTELVASEQLATIGKLAAGVAHEVGNPLSGILGYLSLARTRAAGDEQLSDFLLRIEREVERIGGIVRSLLDLGRTSRREARPIDVGEVARNCATLVSKGPEFLAVHFDFGAIDVVAKAEPGPLSQVLINLFLNAAQAMQGRGRIAVSAQTRGAEVHLRVEDTGPGLAGDVLPRLFEPFFTTKASGEGTGLGLAVSMHLVSEMHGRLTAENRAEGGARFIVTLPAA